MKEILEFEPADLIPEIETILKKQGIPANIEPDKKVVDTLNNALEMFIDLAEPIGIIEDITREDFDDVYFGEGKNLKHDPVGDIYPRADYLALFAITVGEEISNKISSLFNKNDFALASMLDIIASESTEIAGIDTEAFLMEHLAGESTRFKELSILRYSPGYCGWHISGQQKIFEYLEPEEIGITLNDSYLMHPLKSISGVMIVGRPEIHNFEIGFSFCENCRDHECQRRIRSIMKN
ncbi:MAG: vitamin B12 dependent-methionine synthase activation domain-containing protein [Candidatus Zixiibacteriota bacterium]